MKDEKAAHCMECGERVSRRKAVPQFSPAGKLIGYLCRYCAE